jgi:hypothetical protein
MWLGGSRSDLMAAKELGIRVMALALRRWLPPSRVDDAVVESLDGDVLQLRVVDGLQSFRDRRR